MMSLLKKYWLSSLVVLTILVLCFMNTEPLPEVPVKDFDKLVHIIMFGGLSGVVFFDNTRYLRFPVSRLRILLGSFLFPVALGGLIEIGQTYLTVTRNGDWFDFLGNIVGAVLGIGIIFLINTLLERKKQ